MFHDPRTGKRRSRRHDAATLPARVPIAHILIFSSPSNRDRLRVVSPHWNNSEKASRQHYYHPLVVDKCPVTKKTFNPKIDYRKRFIGLAKIEGPEQTTPACVEKEFDVQAANSALQQFNERYTFLVVGKQWKSVTSSVGKDNEPGFTLSRHVEMGETLFKEPATISFLTGAGTQVSPETQGEITMNVKLESIVVPKNNESIMLTFWIIDKKTDAIGKWGDYDSLLESWQCFENGTPIYYTLNERGHSRMEVGSAWTGGHYNEPNIWSTFHSFPWFDALPTHRYYKDFDEIDVKMCVSHCKYKLITPPALEFPVEDELGDEEFDTAVEQWEEDNPDTLTAFELSFAVFASDYNRMQPASKIPFTIDDLCKSVDTVPWI